MRSQRQTLSMDCTHAQTRWNLSPSSSFYLHHWWHHHHHKHPRSYDNLHWFPVFSREPCSSSPSWSARACQSKRFLNQGKTEVFAYFCICVFVCLCICVFAYLWICPIFTIITMTMIRTVWTWSLEPQQAGWLPTHHHKGGALQVLTVVIGYL